MNERDMHFANAAHLLFPEFSKLFFTLYARIQEQRPIEEIDAVEDEIKTLIAQFAYDLVIHAVTHAFPSDLNIFHRMGGTKEFPWEKFFEHIPDMTEWPTDPSTS